MKLDEVARGHVYVDTNVLYMYLRADPVHLPTIERFLQRVVRGDIAAYVSLLTLDELYYRLLLALIKEHTGRNPLDVLRDDLPGTVARYSDGISSALRKLMGLPHFTLVGLEPRDFERMLENIVRFSLLPRDALHITVLQRLGMTAIASDDADFDCVVGIERLWVVNPPE
ncbi:MAG TPA: type II toxin-antitoxin system VapC family toxin [Anaerolineae bacterium]|nr:type II toxin-antitoxin system VapC family toxin [Anaerolineae bacterium]HQI83157.1 type II toxin-antitoxin system VapC family toxin [Anaerolineae bacterium]